MTEGWTTDTQNYQPVDPEILAEGALAMAQATIANAIRDAGIKRADLARQMDRPRSFITRMLSGSHNLTVRTFARALAACGYELSFERTPISWGWVSETPYVQVELELPASAGILALAPRSASILMDTCLTCGAETDFCRSCRRKDLIAAASEGLISEWELAAELYRLEDE